MSDDEGETWREIASHLRISIRSSPHRMTRVVIPSQLYSYTGGETRLRPRAPTIAKVLHDLDRRYPGIRFRVVTSRTASAATCGLFIGREPATDVRAPLREGDEVAHLRGLSGG